ncbi:MAG: DUF2244 domain-containing protein [Wenzhouxiangella sp.]|nr:MAG: DUF2244 domain-containing protein [Wenzhouxiangella sp.]
MVELQPVKGSSNSVVIEARSNLSMTLDRLMAVFAGLCAITLLIVAWPVIMGLWPVLLVALIHLAIVGWCFRLAWRGNWARERIEIDDDRVVVEHFRAGQQARSEWPVAWARVQTEQGRFRDLHVFVSSQGRRQEVGGFLPPRERADLARLLNNALQPRTAWNATQTLRVSRR